MAEPLNDGSSDDDEVYNDVDLISESDGDEPAIEQVEEQMIIGSEEGEDVLGDVVSGTRSESSSAAEEGSDWSGGGLEDLLPRGSSPFFDVAYAHLNPYFANEMEVINVATASDRAACRAASESKRVRFQEDLIKTDVSSSILPSEDGHPFTDLFVQQDQLNPHFRSLIENDQDEDTGSSVSSDDPGPFAGDERSMNEHDTGFGSEDEARPGSSEGSSSGYESDEGETTDEDLPPPQSIASTRAVLRRLSMSSSNADDEFGSRRPRAPLNVSRSRRIGPSLGSWIADPDKPIAVIDSTGKRMVIYPALRQAGTDRSMVGGLADSQSSTVSGSPQRTHVGLYGDMDTQHNSVSSSEQLTPVISSSTRVMMGAPYDGRFENEYLVSGQALGPPEAFYPFMSVDEHVAAQPLEEDDDDDDDDEIMLNVNDFIDFGDGSSDSEDDGDPKFADDFAALSTANTKGAYPVLGSSGGSRGDKGPFGTQSLLDHFDRGVVTAFRRNQSRHKLLFSRPQLRDYTTLGSTSSLESATRFGSMAASQMTISPSRKRRLSMSSNSDDPMTSVGLAPILKAHKRIKSYP